MAKELFGVGDLLHVSLVEGLLYPWDGMGVYHWQLVNGLRGVKDYWIGGGGEYFQQRLRWSREDLDL